MKLTALLLFVICTHVSARSYSQTVSFSGKNVPLQAVFSSLEKQTGLSFFFNYALIKDTKPVTLDVQDVPLEDALKEILKGQELDFYRSGKTIFIVKKRSVQPVSNALQLPTLTELQINVKGRVTNQQGEPLAGATVFLKNGKKGTITDEKGTFELKNVSVGAFLEISYLGYQSKEVSVEGEMINVKLEQAKSQLDEAQVIAYGTTTERLSVGDVTTLKKEDIENQPVNNPLLALEGKVPGMIVSQSSGFSGAGVTVQIQGQNSLNYGNDPLYIIDGVPYSSQRLSTNLDGVLGVSGLNPQTGSANNGSPFSYINPNDIETISVLKDASATSIYGSRAANGAIIITTKRGKSGKAEFKLIVKDGAGSVTRRVNMMNTQEYLKMREEGEANDNVALASTDYDINGVWDTTRYTNWQKTFLGGTAKYNDIQGTISGGSSTSQYLVSAGFHKETTVFPGETADLKGSIHFSLNNISADQKFKLQFSGSYLVDQNKIPGTDYTSVAVGGALPPDAPALYNHDGSLNWAPDPTTGFTSWSGTNTGGNPLSTLTQRTISNTNNLISNLVLSYQILKGLEIKGNFGYTNVRTDENSISPSIAYDPALILLYGNQLRSAQYANSSANSWIIEPQLNYKRQIGEGKLEVLIGATAEQNDSKGQTLLGLNYSSDLLLEDIRSASSIIVISTIDAQYKYNALFGRVNYNWADKYLLDLTLRRDGSSRFGSGNEFHNFGAIGIGWIYTNENWIKDNVPWLSFGKIKGSYGTTGNDQIGDYLFLNQYSSLSYGVAYQGITGLISTGLPNPYLQWEQTNKLQGGMDFGFLKDRILLSMNFYRNRSSNELLSSTLPGITGFTNITANVPATIQNSGAEISLTGNIIHKRNLSWKSSINVTFANNKLLAFPNLANTGYAYSLILGKPFTIHKVYHLAGVDQSSGLYQFSDSHGNPTTSPDPVTDQNYSIDFSPKYYGGWENSISYKSFELGVFFQFVNQIGQNFRFGIFPGAPFFNQPVTALGAWQKAGDISSVQRYYGSNSATISSFRNAQVSDAAYSSASFIRLKNVALSWQVPNLSKAHIQNCRVFIQGQNLLTITKYMGLDPETRSSSVLPPLRIVTAGIQLTL